jgi:hypothetical protein
MFVLPIVFFFCRNMFLSGSQSNFNTIQPLPRFYTFRFGRRTEIDDDDEKHREYKIKEVNLKKILI